MPRLHAVAERTGAEGGQPVEEEGAAVAHGHRHPHVAAQAGIVVAGARLPLTTHCGQGPAPQVQPHRRHRATAPRLQQAGRQAVRQAGGQARQAGRQAGRQAVRLGRRAGRQAVRLGRQAGRQAVRLGRQAGRQASQARQAGRQAGQSG